MELKTFFQEHNKIALGFSGGVDSSYLLYAAKAYGADVFPIFIKSQFQPDFELEDATRLADMLDIKMKVVYLDALQDSQVAENSQKRCYYCKQNMFNALTKAARAAGYLEIIDGTNASDEAEDRPGMQALKEMKVLSPLRLCGVTKEAVRQQSKEAGLFSWNKPAYACLATRIPTGETITDDMLHNVEQAEAELSKMGFHDFRVRVFGEAARLQLTEAQLGKAIAERENIREVLKPFFTAVLIDLEERK